MRYILKKFFAGFVSMLLLFGAAVTAFASQENTAETPAQTELYVAASQIKDLGAYNAIQSALDMARNNAGEDNVCRVTVERGSYDLTRSLHIYSNTHLVLNGVTLARNSKSIANMLRTGEYDTVNSGATGYDAYSNITVEGGIFDGGGTGNTMIKVAHAKNFTMLNTELKNVKNGHIMEIAGVDGFNVKGCTFEDQLMDADKVGYEAIQLDILKSGHIVECRSEALAMKNILIENCKFINCPRGIGTHTSILNNPFNGVIIRNNSFTDMGSAAIQGMNWINCEITGNYIENTPRGISIYSVMDGGQGTYPASVIASEGKTSSDISDKYKKPGDSNILIAGNTIKGCGAVEDIYAAYDSSAISVVGKKITGISDKFYDGSGGLPNGDYYIDGVKIIGNTIDVSGTGMRLSNVCSAELSNNSIKCGKNKFDSAKHQGVKINYGSKISSIINCDIEGSANSGIYLDGSTVTKITGCRIADSAADSIQLNNSSKITEISDNYISGTKDCGVAVMSKSSVGSVSNNNIRGYKYKAVYTAKNASAKRSNNYSAEAELKTIGLGWGRISMGLGESYVFDIAVSPRNAKSSFMWSSSNSDVVAVDYNGKIKAVGLGTAEVTVRAANGASSTCKVMVSSAPESISLNENMLILGEGEQFDLNSRIPEGSSSQKIYYYSNNEKSVSVEKYGGMVTAESVGTATVVVKTFNNRLASCNVIVKSAPYAISLDKDRLSLGIGEKGSVKAKLSDNTASAVTYKTSDSSVVTVDGKGEVCAVAKGTATITASTYNGLAASCTVTVSDAPEGISLNRSSATLRVGESIQLESEISGGSSHVTYKSSDPNVCRVDLVTGVLTGKSNGGAVITVTTYNGKSATCFVRVRN